MCKPIDGLGGCGEWECGAFSAKLREEGVARDLRVVRGRDGVGGEERRKVDVVRVNPADCSAVGSVESRCDVNPGTRDDWVGRQDRVSSFAIEVVVVRVLGRKCILRLLLCLSISEIVFHEAGFEEGLEVRRRRRQYARVRPDASSALARKDELYVVGDLRCKKIRDRNLVSSTKDLVAPAH